MYKISIQYDNKEYNQSSNGGNLLDVIRKAGIPIGAPCGGKGTCKKCKVQIKNPETKLLSKTVLACEQDIQSDLVLEVPTVSEARIISESYWPDLNIIWDKHDSQSTYGIAIDIGTTTVVVYLEDLSTHNNIGTRSFLNPQSSYGADVISRIQSVMQQPESLREQKQVIIRALNDAILKLTNKNNLNPNTISQISIAGNSPMLHLLLGIDPTGLAVFPFTPSFLDEKTFKGEEIGFDHCPSASVKILPSLSSYVGADIIAGISATELPDNVGYSLYIDIGTNGEMALGNKDQILTCATAAGPAFEGANISCGLGGINGAIHSFNGTEYKTIGGKQPSGLCGSGLVDAIAWLLNTGKLDSGGYLEEPITLLEGDIMSDGLPMQLTPQDIREVQLAKGAIAAGIKTLMDEAGIDETKVERLYLAGGFGYAIHVESAIKIGLIPSALKDKVIRAGNLAGLGARLDLHSKDFNKRLNKLREKAKYFELSNHVGFNEAFVMSMYF